MKVVWLLQDLHAAGERPSYADVKHYLAVSGLDRLGAWREQWSATFGGSFCATRATGFVVSVVDGECHFTPSKVVIEENGLHPDLEQRVEEVLGRAVGEFARSATGSRTPRATRQRSETSLRHPRASTRFGDCVTERQPSAWFLSTKSTRPYSTSSSSIGYYEGSAVARPLVRRRHRRDASAPCARPPVERGTPSEAARSISPWELLGALSGSG